MKLSSSIEMIMQLAGQEAVAGEFESIRPEHLLAAVLKFSELPVDEIAKAAPGSEAAKQLPIEVSALRSEFTTRGIDTTQIRRQLRATLGKGGHPFDGGAIHRSDEARAIFDSAARIADEAVEDTLTASHLFEAVLKAPTKAIAELLSESQRGPVKRASDTPLLDQHGVDLTALARAGQLANSDDRQVEAKALLEALTRANAKGILLIFEDWKTAQAVATAAAWAIAKKAAPQPLQRTRILDISSLPPNSPSGASSVGYEQLLEEAANAKDVVVLMSPIYGGPANSGRNHQMDALGGILRSKPLHFILPVAVAAYTAMFKNDVWWKKNAHPIWVRKDRGSGVPTEL